ncbi:MAG TPA: endonuclease III [Bacilli bacterium]|nr:endonuclease III [Bacilli bacterium]HPY78811.1 endonuclease III [Bacilli bacterium]HQB96701.1 endonuclease III [Bacilli bacterium]
MTRTNKERILAFLDKEYSDAKGELEYTKDYELLIAVVLSAQSTDVAVNNVTRKLFAKYPTFESLLNVKEAQFAAYFKTLGLYRNKAKHVYNLIHLLNEHHNGVVPSAKEELLKLPGVGVKTANVVRAELFNIPEIAVDTHVSRIARRLGFAKFSDDVTIIEAKLRKVLPKERYIKTHHQMIHFGRYFCKAQSPLCKKCPLVDICKEPNKKL